MKIATLALAAAVMIVTACTENLTTPGTCPTFCPGGSASFHDTTLTAVVDGDSSFTGYLEPNTLASVLVSDGGNYGERRAVIRFLTRGDSVSISDTARSFTVDSVSLELGIQDRDTTVANFVLDVYRIPAGIDSSASFATVDALLTPANLIAEIPQGVSERSGLIHAVFRGDSLGLVNTFAPADSEVLEIGLRVRADGPTAARIGTPASGTFAPLVTTYVTANGVVDSLKSSSVSKIAGQFFTVAPPAAPTPSDLLAVGGLPVSRSFIRFVLPEYLRDSATIVRATLQLTASAPVVGIPADTATLVASPVLVDFGAKSPVVAIGASAVLLPGTGDVTLEVAGLVQLWQGKTPTPSIIRLALAQEGGTFIFPLYRSTRSASGAPTLRITYSSPFGFRGF